MPMLLAGALFAGAQGSALAQKREEKKEPPPKEAKVIPKEDKQPKSDERRSGNEQRGGNENRKKPD
jgi:hypothetical protein